MWSPMCCRWLDVSEGDGVVEADLLATEEESGKMYRIDITTGNVKCVIFRNLRVSALGCGVRALHVVGELSPAVVS